ncbi:nitroreductase family deazaflavin-dependent oxidoreductase [Actinocorallia longicatena]|uniref:Nitroreductase family deazaflavin-dependent oxidoreductase n=1 Tax=Actinocorallia longicatena TaxID=111803 RepID=A0ABP6QMP9_9ACTN
MDSPTGWVRKHIDAYVASGGEKGHDYHGRPSLLLTTTGRRSGLRRRTALIYGLHGESPVVVASNGGAADHPLWFANLAADPAVEVQVGAEVFTATARLATEAERPALWEQMVGIHPEYASYQRKCERLIPVVVLDRA